MTRTRMEKIKAGACVLALAAALAAVPAAGGSYAACGGGGENFEGGQSAGLGSRAGQPRRRRRRWTLLLNGVSFPKLGGDFRSARMNARGMNARESGN